MMKSAYDSNATGLAVTRRGLLTRTSPVLFLGGAQGPPGGIKAQDNGATRIARSIEEAYQKLYTKPERDFFAQVEVPACGVPA